MRAQSVLWTMASRTRTQRTSGRTRHPADPPPGRPATRRTPTRPTRHPADRYEVPTEADPSWCSSLPRIQPATGSRTATAEAPMVNVIVASSPA